MEDAELLKQIERTTYAFNTHDVDALVRGYEPEAVFVLESGQYVKGHEALKKAFTALLELKPVVTIDKKRVIQQGELALFVMAWCFEGQEGLARKNISTSVMRKQANGKWLVAIGNPFGSDIL